MSLSVLIPTAGTGSRMGNKTTYINKSLLSLSYRPVICHIIEQFPYDAEFVIALGYKGALVKEFLTMAYPERKFFFAQVPLYEGEGSGLGLSVLSCRKFLSRPFIFISCDTLVKGKIPVPDHNWMGYAELDDISQYRTLVVDRDSAGDICEKGIGKAATHKPYIGLAGIYDWKKFWSAMENGKEEAVIKGEVYGMQALLKEGIKAYRYNWFDTGNPKAFERTKKAYTQKDGPNILEKENEAIWFVGDRVIKYSDDKNFISGRIKRAKTLKGFVPQITGHTENMYCYNKVEGTILSRLEEVAVFKELLAQSLIFWEIADLSEPEMVRFNSACKRFYKDKTLGRIDLFYKNFHKKDSPTEINGQNMPRLSKMLADVDWDWLADGLPGRFHGDFHFENILYSEKDNTFVFLDWRQSFGESVHTGDIYYDLSKLLHGLIVCHELIVEDRFSVEWENETIRFDLDRKPVLLECEEFFYKWLSDNSYDYTKVRVLTALIYLNIAGLHHYPYSLLLYALGKQMLWQETNH